MRYSSGVGKCPHFSHHPTKGEYNLQQRLEKGDVQNPQNRTFTNPCLFREEN
jgi:hypothetical protein